MILSTKIIVNKDNPGFHRKTIFLEDKPEWIITWQDDLSIHHCYVTNFQAFLTSHQQMTKEIAMYISPEDKTKMINLPYFWDLVSWETLRNPVDNLILFSSLKEIVHVYKVILPLMNFLSLFFNRTRSWIFGDRYTSLPTRTW